MLHLGLWRDFCTQKIGTFLQLSHNRVQQVHKSLTAMKESKHGGSLKFLGIVHVPQSHKVQVYV